MFLLLQMCILLIPSPHAALCGLWAQLPVQTRIRIFLNVQTVQAKVVSLSIVDLI